MNSRHIPLAAASLAAALAVAAAPGTSAAQAQTSQGAASGGRPITTTQQSFQQPPPQPQAVPQEPRDGFRLRGGLSLGGGPIIPFGIGSISSVGGLGGLSVRFGAQFSHLFGLYVQSQNSLGGLAVVTMAGSAEGVILAQSFNSLLASFTFFHALEFAAGASFDYIGFAGCGATSMMQACDAGSGVGFGLHGRAALNLGGIIGNGPRRIGFNIGTDVHPVFFVGQGGGYLNITLSLGVEFH